MSGLEQLSAEDRARLEELRDMANRVLGELAKLGNPSDVFAAAAYAIGRQAAESRAAPNFDAVLAGFAKFVLYGWRDGGGKDNV